MQIRGIIPPVATPMQANEDLDLPRFRWFLDHLIGAGVHGYVARLATFLCKQLAEILVRGIAVRVVLDALLPERDLAIGVAWVGCSNSAAGPWILELRGRVRFVNERRKGRSRSGSAERSQSVAQRHHEQRAERDEHVTFLRSGGKLEHWRLRPLVWSNL